LDQAAAAVGDETEDFDDAGTEHIFVVEDDQAVRSLMVDALDRWGYQTTVCSSPDEALKKIEDQAPQFDLLLTDVVMPGMNGLEMARRIHAQYKLQRVLYVSGYAEGQLDASQLKSPPGEVLPKPFTPRELARAVRRALDELHPSDGSPDVGEYTNDQTETPATGRQ
jgi:two-component system cell cycle response regulator CpdR